MKKEILIRDLSAALGKDTKARVTSALISYFYVLPEYNYLFKTEAGVPTRSQQVEIIDRIPAHAVLVALRRRDGHSIANMKNIGAKTLNELGSVLRDLGVESESHTEISWLDESRALAKEASLLLFKLTKTLQDYEQVSKVRHSPLEPTELFKQQFEKVRTQEIKEAQLAVLSKQARDGAASEFGGALKSARDRIREQDLELRALRAIILEREGSCVSENESEETL